MKKKQRLVIRPEDSKGEEKEYLVPRGRHVTVHVGEFVRAGDRGTTSLPTAGGYHQ